MFLSSLAVQDSSIVGLSLTHSLTEWVSDVLISEHYNDYNDYNDYNNYNDYNDYNGYNDYNN